MTHEIEAKSISLHDYGDNLRITYRGVEYLWFGSFGSIIESFERDVKQDELRQFGNVTLYAYVIDKTKKTWGGKYKVKWTAYGIDMEWIRSFKRALFSL